MHARVMEDLGWQVVGQPGRQIFVRTLGPVGVGKIQRPKAINLNEIDKIRKKYHLLTLYIEPGLTTTSTNLGIAVEPFAHSTTSILDLTLSEGQLLTSFSQKTRYNIAHTLKQKALNIRSTPLNKLADKEKAAFMSLRATWSRRKHVEGHSELLLGSVLHHYRGHGTLHTAWDSTDCLGALLILEHDHVATYYSAFATELGNRRFAPTLLTWLALETAKKNKCDIFDFGGTYDPRYPKMYKKWQGFTKFKEGFRPTTITYPPTYLKIGWPLI